MAKQHWALNTSRLFTFLSYSGVEEAPNKSEMPTCNYGHIAWQGLSVGAKGTITPTYAWWICTGSPYIPLPSKSLTTREVFEFMLLTPLWCKETPLCRWEIWVQQVHSLVFRVSRGVQRHVKRRRPRNTQELCKWKAWEWGAIGLGTGRCSGNTQCFNHEVFPLKQNETQRVIRKKDWLLFSADFKIDYVNVWLNYLSTSGNLGKTEEELSR